MKEIIIAPFVKFIEIIFLWAVKNTGNLGLALILLSLVVTIVLLPLYYLAEKLAQKEKNIQKQMKPKIDEFKSVYKGYELNLYIKNVHRLNGYHQVYSLRSLISLLIQVPFFIGAYVYLSSYAGFEGVTFWGIANLASPDSLISIKNISINVLPLIMTFFNLASGYVYSMDSTKSEKLTVVIIALVFLLLLYKSPASLLIYWTFNNIFSLLKNLIVKFYFNKRNINSKVAGGTSYV